VGNFAPGRFDNSHNVNSCATICTYYGQRWAFR
jgi:hypothetical protein